MLNGLHEIDWSSLHHAYGSAEEVPALLAALGSPDPEERDKALSRYYAAVHHQGSVYPSTIASLPFLFELAEDHRTPDRAEIVRLLVSIGQSAIERGDVEDGDAEFFTGAGATMRRRADVFAGFVSEPDPQLRRAAIPALGHFLEDAHRAAHLLRTRLPEESGIVERLLLLEAMAVLALRLPQATDEAMAWFTELASDPTAAPEIRLAAVVQRARCTPDRIGPDVVPAAIELLSELAQVHVPASAWADPPRKKTPKSKANGVPPHILAAFEDLERHGRVHSPTTDLLRTFHQTLTHRVPERTALLGAQLRDPDPGARLDALRMSGDLMRAWRGDHAPLITLVADQLGAEHLEVAGEAAAVLEACHVIAGPAREALAQYVAEQRTTYGPNVWATTRPHLGRAHQDAVLALARLGDVRAVPSLVAAFDSGVDAWRAVQVAGSLPEATDALVPRLCAHLRRLELAQGPAEMSVRSALSALASLGDPAALPVVHDTLTTAVGIELWGIACSALETLRAFGSAAAPALAEIRALTGSTDAHVRPAAVAALWAVGRDHEEVMPLLLDLLDDTITFRISEAAEVLGQIGAPAAAALPRLRSLLAHGYEWVRVPCAAALWDIGGEPEAPAVLDTLLQAWTKNPATANNAVACLARMGTAAAPALPLLRFQLALPRRGGRFSNISNDEDLQRISQEVIRRLS
ncbi:HEAT repeat domain-containing protein [Streptacidiphilus anmyonensis]|uniref:HEAT repeat domain-containing protein n=1 Tax=Streptacidiphilus anmyonensis TaxID=405782 RepID=UPI0005AADE40|nr:HEAT repeat domain-containing protein [Streptacidiphilus anmyonensis]